MPCTPQTPYTPSVDDIGDKTPHYTDDGIFKIPTIKNTPTKQDTEVIVLFIISLFLEIFLKLFLIHVDLY